MAQDNDKPIKAAQETVNAPRIIGLQDMMISLSRSPQNENEIT